MDETGEHSSGYSQDITKVRLDLSGKEIELGETVCKFFFFFLPLFLSYVFFNILKKHWAIHLKE